MIQFLLGYVLGSAAKQDSGRAPARLTSADLMVVTQVMFTLACCALLVLLLAPLLAGPVFDVLAPGWSWKLRVGAAIGIVAVNLIVGLALRFAVQYIDDESVDDDR